MSRLLTLGLAVLLCACGSRPQRDAGSVSGDRDGGVAPNVDLGDPCLRNNGGCDERASCASNRGEVSCTCPEGLLGTGVGCFDPVEASVDDEVRPTATGSARGFGLPVAMSRDGLTLAVGDVGEGSDSRGAGTTPTTDANTRTGAVWVYRRSGDGWAFDSFIKAFNPGPRDFFGAALALSDDGTTLAVGAPGEDTLGFGVDPEANDPVPNGDNQRDFDSGAVYVYRRGDAGWAREAFLKPQDAAFRIFSFGANLSLSGDGSTLGVGAAADGVQIHVREGSAWRFADAVRPPVIDTSTFGGTARFSGNGDVLVVGYALDDTNGVGVDPMPTGLIVGSGAARVYRRDGDRWEHESYLKAPNPGLVDDFGVLVAISTDGTVVAALAPREDGSGSGVNPSDDDDGQGSGAAYVYRYVDGVWTFEAYLKAQPNDMAAGSLESLALSGDGRVLAVGAPEESTGLGGLQREPSGTMNRSGAVYLFRHDGGGWFFEARLKEDVPMSGAGLGISLDFDDVGRRLAVGAREDGGRVTIFDLLY